MYAILSSGGLIFNGFYICAALLIHLYIARMVGGNSMTSAETIEKLTELVKMQADLIMEQANALAQFGVIAEFDDFQAFPAVCPAVPALSAYSPYWLQGRPMNPIVFG